MWRCRFVGCCLLIVIAHNEYMSLHFICSSPPLTRSRQHFHAFILTNLLSCCLPSCHRKRNDNFGITANETTHEVFISLGSSRTTSCSYCHAYNQSVASKSIPSTENTPSCHTMNNRNETNDIHRQDHLHCTPSINLAISLHTITGNPSVSITTNST